MNHSTPRPPSPVSPSASDPCTVLGPGPAPWHALQSAFHWPCPARLNIAQAIGQRWAQRADAAQRVAVIEHAADAPPRAYTWADLQRQANQLQCVLTSLGVQRGDRVAIVLPQRAPTVVAYWAVWQMGAVAVPLSQLFGPDALAFRLCDSGARLALGDASTLGALRAATARAPQLAHLLLVDGLAEQPPVHTPVWCELDWATCLAGFDGAPQPLADTAADDPAVLIYTSGTTGNPKGALIAQRALIGNLSGFVCSQNGFGWPLPRADGGGAPLLPIDPLAQADALPDLASGSQAVFWSPADWAWTGGLMDALLPCLYFGRPIVAWAGRFSADTALDILRRHAVTHTFLFPTALKALMKQHPGAPVRSVRAAFDLRLQALMSAGEALGDAVFDYCRSQLGVTPNEMFGQTEINYVVGNCAPLWPAKPGSMGLAYPGHRVAVIDASDQVCASGEVGEVAVHRLDAHGQPDPIFFLGYWLNEAATREKFTGDPQASWCRTGDLARCDAEGYLWYEGRADDVFKSAGYRIGPGEIENCLLKHPAVANAAVVPKPDPERGAVVKAYVVLAPETIAARACLASDTADFDAKLVADLQAHVRARLAPYEYPKAIEFIDALPMTTTGKVQRRVLRLQEQARAQAGAGPDPARGR